MTGFVSKGEKLDADVSEAGAAEGDDRAGEGPLGNLDLVGRFLPGAAVLSDEEGFQDLKVVGIGCLGIEGNLGQGGGTYKEDTEGEVLDLERGDGNGGGAGVEFFGFGQADGVGEGVEDLLLGHAPAGIGPALNVSRAGGEGD